MVSRRLRREDYNVGWVSPLPVELAAAKLMLDEEHDDPRRNENVTNLYTFGQIAGHNVVMACLPAGQEGNNSAAAVALQMSFVFQSIRFILMVGVGGGVPSENADIRLGDVVVSQPRTGNGGVVQYDFGKATPGRFMRTGFLNAPPSILLAAISTVTTNHLMERCRLSEHLSKLARVPRFARANAGPDVLFEATYEHVGGQACESCSEERQVRRTSRDNQEIVVHYGTIASGNQVMRDGATRDEVSREFGGVLCFEMEAAGLMNTFPCLVIRGICDYADSHKNKRWQAYAASTAAAYAMEVLSVIPTTAVLSVTPATELVPESSAQTEHQPSSSTPPTPIRQPRPPDNSDRTQDQLPQHDLEAAANVYELAERSTTRSFRSSGRSGEQASNDESVTDLVRQGHCYLDRRDGYQDLATARRYFLQACDILNPANPSDSAAFVEIYYGLTNVELDMSRRRELGLEEMESHLRKAEEYGEKAFEKARSLQNAEELAITEFNRGLVKARRVEIEAKKGHNTGAISKLKDEAQRAISRSVQELRDANCSAYQDFFNLAKVWEARLNALDSGRRNSIM